jgi:hypothetical protein
LWTEKRTCRVARISMAVPQVSESPWAKWASPAEKSPPLAYTGTYMRVPAESCLMSTLPAVSRGGTVRSASAAIAGSAGTASVGSGGSTKPPRSSAACSRAMVASSRRRSGASPMVPMKGAPGTRTPGRSSEVAQPPAIAHRTMNGSGNWSRRKPNPGTWTV